MYQVYNTSPFLHLHVCMYRCTKIVPTYMDSYLNLCLSLMTHQQIPRCLRKTQGIVAWLQWQQMELIDVIVKMRVQFAALAHVSLS